MLMSTECRYSTVATLGGPYSCSHSVARRSGIAREIHGYPSFELAADDVRSHKCDALLVPSAYPSLHAFMMDDALVACTSFIEPIPALVLTCALTPVPDRVAVLFHHPATQTLLPKVRLDHDASVFASSNEDAVAMMLASATDAAAITNELVTQNRGLPVLQVLRPQKPMGWIVFERA